MKRISTNGILWKSIDGFRIKSLADVAYFLDHMICTKNAIIQVISKNDIIYQLRNTDNIWHLICMMEIGESGLFVEHDTLYSKEEILKFVYKHRKNFNEYFFSKE